MKYLSLALAAAFLVTSPVGEVLAKQKCPPGLAKKNPPCVPPGLAKKGVRQDDRVISDRYEDDDDYLRRDDRVIIWGEDDWRDRYYDRYGRDYYEDRRIVLGPDGQLYEVGDVMRPDDYVLVSLEDLLTLPLLRDGNTYVRVGGKVVEMVEVTGQIVDTVGAVEDLLN